MKAGTAGPTEIVLIGKAGEAGPTAMPDWRRRFVPGGSYFFTQVVFDRARIFLEQEARAILFACFAECQEKWPFTGDAFVLLPDHMHAIWTLPPGDSAYPRRWGWIKKEFTKRWLTSGHPESLRSRGRFNDGRRAVWQTKYWEHTLEDEHDFERHFDYIHFNPVKHRWVECPHEWAWSTFHAWVEKGVYEPHWACFTKHLPTFQFKDIARTVGE